jgi:hypothetical protein
MKGTLGHLLWSLGTLDNSSEKRPLGPAVSIEHTQPSCWLAFHQQSCAVSSGSESFVNAARVDQGPCGDCNAGASRACAGACARASCCSDAVAAAKAAAVPKPGVVSSAGAGTCPHQASADAGPASSSHSGADACPHQDRSTSSTGTDPGPSTSPQTHSSANTSAHTSADTKAHRSPDAGTYQSSFQCPGAAGGTPPSAWSSAGTRQVRCVTRPAAAAGRAASICVRLHPGRQQQVCGN